MLAFWQRNKKICLCLGAALLALLLLGGVSLLFRWDAPKDAGHPTLALETKTVSLSEDETFTLDVTISSLGEALYPAASVSIAFDSSRLEFLGVEEGNLFVKSAEASSGQALPEWSCSAAASNESGKINLMYLDLTSGKNAFTKELHSGEHSVLLRLSFRLRGSVMAGEVCELLVEDAVFAASNEKESLAMTQGTLKVKNGKLLVED